MLVAYLDEVAGAGAFVSKTHKNDNGSSANGAFKCRTRMPMFLSAQQILTTVKCDGLSNQRCMLTRNSVRTFNLLTGLRRVGGVWVVRGEDEPMRIGYEHVDRL